MKKLLVALVLCLIPAIASATTVVLQWTQTTDTTITGQKVYYDSQATPPFKGTTATQGAAGFAVPNGTGGTVSGLDSTKAWYFYVTNVNTSGMESPISNIVTVPAFPAAPTGLKFIAISP
jgi:hypothetical protein